MPTVQLDPSLIGGGGGNAFATAYQNALANGFKNQAAEQDIEINRYKMDTARQEQQQSNALAQLLGRQGFDAKTPQGQSDLYSAGGVKGAQTYLKGQGDLAKVNADTAKHTSDTRKVDIENSFKRLELVGQFLGGSTDQATHTQMRAQMAANPELAEIAKMIPEQYDPNAVAMFKKVSMPEKDRLAAEHQRLTLEETGRSNRAREDENRANNIDQTRDRGLTREQANDHYNMTDARTRESTAATLAQGKVPSGYRANLDGSLAAIPGGPADQTKPTAEYSKQADAYQNMDDALTGYRKVLQGFDTLSMMNPSKRAEMGTAYQNTLLQAKEIYKLGVLNGGDERILKAVINNPLDMTSLMLPKEAMIKQADDLQAIIKRGNDNLAKVYKQPALALNSQASTATDAASYAKLPSGATYTAPNGKTYTKK